MRQVRGSCMEGDVLIQLISILGGFIAVLGGSVGFLIRYIVKKSERDMRAQIDVFKVAIESNEKNIESLIKSNEKNTDRVVQSIDMGYKGIYDQMALNARRIIRLRKDVKELATAR